MIDATYKTTRYDLALFFICVRTNVGYTIVAEFITQSETAEHILEALLILKSWNLDWQPKFFMSDYSEAKHDALEQAFPGIKVFLCGFNNAGKDGFVIQNMGSPKKKASSSLGTCGSVLLLNQDHLKLFHWNSTMKKL